MTPLLTAFAGTPEKNQVYNLDLFDLCAAMPSASVDMILCDLPYAVTPASWDILIPLEPMWAAFKRIAKPKVAIVLTATQPFTTKLIASNYGMFKYSWLWDKVRPVGFLNAKVRPMMQHEDVIVFADGSPNYYPQMREAVRHGKRNSATSQSETNGKIDLVKSRFDYGKRYPSSIIKFSHGYQTDKVHPTQKPVDLFRYLIRTYTEVGQVVFDPCVGSGTTAVAAREEGRSFIVGDSSLEYVEIARARLAAPYTPSFMPQLELAG